MKSLNEVISEMMQARPLEDSIPDEWPTLSNEEHTRVETMVGHTLTNQEAQQAIRNASVETAIRYWSNGKAD